MKWKLPLGFPSFRQAIGLTITAAVVPFVLAGAAVYQIERDRDLIMIDNQYLDQEMALIDRKIAEIENLEWSRSQILARKRVIESLSQGRFDVQMMLLSLSWIPEGIQLSSAELDDRRGLIEGQAVSASLISRLTQELQESPARWITRVERVSDGSGQGLLNFRIVLSRDPRDDESDF